eukprot:7034416-Prymnesium_polylepis.1
MWQDGGTPGSPPDSKPRCAFGWYRAVACALVRLVTPPFCFWRRASNPFANVEKGTSNGMVYGG